MSLDGCLLHQQKLEFNNILVNTRIDKIHQPSKDELVVLLRGFKQNYKLHINVNPSVARINLTQTVPPNPMQPPMFCMLLRKHLSGAKLVNVTQQNLERILIFNFETTNEMGDTVNLKLAVEFIGKQTNIVLVGNNNRIIDCIKRSDIESNSRMLLPGAVYRYPETLGKLNILNTECLNIINNIKRSHGRLSDILLSLLDGFSPLVCREITFRSYGNTDIRVEEISDYSLLTETLEQIKQILIFGGTPCTLKQGELKKDFSFLPITQYGIGFETEEYNNYSELLFEFFNEKTNKARINSQMSNLKKTLNNLKVRTERKINARKLDLKKCESREQYRVYGELIKANLYKIPKGATEAVVENYYDPNCSLIKIPLNSAFSPADNAQKYFKEYKKMCVATNTLGGLINQSEQELAYIESVIESLSRAETLGDLEQIKEEVISQGYLKKQKSAVKKQMPVSINKYISPDGFTVMVGKNNKQNDELTFKIAQKHDLWLHAKNIPGSHVIIVTNGEQVPQTTVNFAAKLAAANSKGSNSSNVPVDCVPVKLVKKPNGAKPGMVIFTGNTTLFVTP